MTVNTPKPPRCYTIHEREGSQTKALTCITSSVQLAAFFKDQADGGYTIRDCLGGLRMIVRVKDSLHYIIETTR